MCDDVRERASLQELHDDPELVLHQVAVLHLDDVGVVVVAHYHDLEEGRRKLNQGLKHAVKIIGLQELEFQPMTNPIILAIAAFVF